MKYTEHPTSNEVALFYQILFIVLKLTGGITWEWIWVLAPMWIPIAMLMIASIILVIVKKLKA